MLGNIGDFSPDNESVLIAQVIEILIMLVVRQSDGVGAHFQQQCHIFVMFLFCQRTSKSLPILMAGSTAKPVGFTVEKEPFSRVESNAPATKTGLYGIPTIQLTFAGI